MTSLIFMALKYKLKNLRAVMAQLSASTAKGFSIVVLHATLLLVASSVERATDQAQICTLVRLVRIDDDRKFYKNIYIYTHT